MADHPQTMISIATIEDSKDLARLGSETFVESFGHMYRESDLHAFLSENHSQDAYRKAINNPRSKIWIARTKDGNAVGFASAGPCHLPVPDQPPNAGELGRLYIRQSHQGFGLGVRLLEQALEFLDATFEHIYLSVFSENLAAQRLYKRYHFEIFHEYHFMVGQHADEEYLMRRTRHTKK
ncbi:MAG: GNAT family N-acetyltransferase [Pseudomonadota bacterium]